MNPKFVPLSEVEQESFDYINVTTMTYKKRALDSEDRRKVKALLLQIMI